MQKEEVAKVRLTVPKQHIVIVEVKHGEAVERVAWGYNLQLDKEAGGGTPVERIVTSFPDRQGFVLHLPYDAGDEYTAPLTILYRMQNRGPIRLVSNLYQAVWNKQKKQFESDFPHNMKRYAQSRTTGFFTQIEEGGELVRIANTVSAAVGWSAVVLGVGRVLLPESDPFTYKAE